MRQILALFFFLIAAAGLPQIAPSKYFIEFTDKNGTPFSISDPSQFLTQRAIDRRNRQGIAVIEQDLPVTPDYVNQVKNIGVIVLTRSKWFNGITIYCNDTTKLDTILQLPFVKDILKSTGAGYTDTGRKYARAEGPGVSNSGNILFKAPALTFNYGRSYNQIHMLKGDVLHDLGFRGQGMVIAVLDAGFENADTLSVFDSIRSAGQILGTKDFVVPGNNVYHEFYHGTAVLSAMAGNVPGTLIGTAPKASYWLLRSEDANSENIIEEYNWVSAAEFADSVGADVINSSLGYTVFDDSTQNHTCADMTGNTTPATRGANIAASKGMVVSNSAGNEGGSSWQCPSAPSDGYNVVCVAAVDSLEQRAFFSSVGFITDTLVKPTVAAQGEHTWAAGSDGNYYYFSGTSLSSPLIAGMTACLWQSNPGSTWKQVVEAMEESASQFTAPDSLLGYGIPDFSEATGLLGINEPVSGRIRAYPNPFSGSFTLDLGGSGNGPVEISVYDILGSMVFHRTISSGTGETRVVINDLNSMAPGLYVLRYFSGNYPGAIRLIKTAR